MDTWPDNEDFFQGHIKNKLLLNNNKSFRNVWLQVLPKGEHKIMMLRSYVLLKSDKLAKRLLQLNISEQLILEHT